MVGWAADSRRCRSVHGVPRNLPASGGSRSEVGVVFAATMLVRAPVYVFQGFAASLLPNLTVFRALTPLGFC